MRGVRSVWLALGLVCLWGQVAQAVTCSCRAADGSCSASITCTAGCFATCGTSVCSAGCTGSGDGGGIDQQNYSVVNHGGGMSAAEVSEALSAELGRPFVYVPGHRQEVLTFEFQQAPPSEIARALAKSGAVAMASQDRNRFFVRAEDADAATIADAVQQITTGRFELTPRDPRLRFTLDAKGVRLSDLPRVLSDIGDGLVKATSPK